MLQKTRTLFFYAPLKSPLHSVPSGDRLMARQLVHLFEMIGFKVVIISHFRSRYNGKDSAQLEAIQKEAERELQSLIERYKEKAPEELPHLWFTYHLYYKAPDYLGPAFCKTFNIPYAVAEASIANKRAEGAWQDGHQHSVAALKQADYIFSFARHDVAGIQSFIRKDAKHYLITPFLDANLFKLNYKPPLGKTLRFLTVAMMRGGDKFASYCFLAELLSKFKGERWTLSIAGAGEMEAAVQKLFFDKYAFRKEQIHFKGMVKGEALKELYQTHDAMIWPAINEAYGMTFLEAHFCGLPVIAGNYGSVSSIVEDGKTGWLIPAGNFELFSSKIALLLKDASPLKKMGNQARRKALEEHSLDKLASKFSKIFAPIFE